MKDNTSNENLEGVRDTPDKPDRKENQLQPDMLGLSNPLIVFTYMRMGREDVASIAITEFMVMTTKLRAPERFLHYRGHRGIVTIVKDEPQPGCYYCKSIRGKYNSLDVGRYLKRK